jgi:hypothetical protein
MRRSFFALLAFALLEASGGPVVWLGASASGGSVASLSVPREWLDRSRVAADLTAAGATLALECFGAADVYSLGDMTFGVPSCIVFAVAFALVVTKRFSPLWGLALGAVVGLCRVVV